MIKNILIKTTLLVFYYIIFTPYALVLKLFGINYFIQNPKNKSYWNNR